MNPLIPWIMAIMLIMATIRFLPFINIDAAFRLQMWARDLLRKIKKGGDK